MKKCMNTILVAVACLGIMFAGASVAVAKDMKIGVINATKIVNQSDAGQKAQKEIAAKKAALEKPLQAFNDEVIALQKDFEKKSSAWTDAVKKEKEIELKQKARDLRIKQDDANVELNKYREERMTPVIKTLNDILPKVAKDKKLDVILDTHVVAYFSEDADLTDDMLKALNKAMK